jgi:hypothetical protein
MRYSIKKGDPVVTPYSNKPCITPNKVYHVIKRIGNSYIELKDDTGVVRQYDIHTFFIADAYFTWCLYRVVKILIDFEDRILII